MNVGRKRRDHVVFRTMTVSAIPGKLRILYGPTSQLKTKPATSWAIHSAQLKHIYQKITLGVVTTGTYLLIQSLHFDVHKGKSAGKR